MGKRGKKGKRPSSYGSTEDGYAGSIGSGVGGARRPSSTASNEDTPLLLGGGEDGGTTALMGMPEEKEEGLCSGIYSEEVEVHDRRGGASSSSQRGTNANKKASVVSTSSYEGSVLLKTDLDGSEGTGEGVGEHKKNALRDFANLLSGVEEAIESGIFPERIYQGSSGSYFCKNMDGRKVGVFKPKNEEPYGQLNPKWTKWLHKMFCPCCFGRGCLVPNQGYLSEVGASLVDQVLDLNVVPLTELVSLYSPTFNYRREWCSCFSKTAKHPLKVGSFQTFVNGFTDAVVFLQEYDIHKLPAATQHQFRVQFESLVILDYLTRNTDRGNDNWLIKLEYPEVDDTIFSDHRERRSSQPNLDLYKRASAGSLLSSNSEVVEIANQVPTITIAAIDNGLSFPFKHPDEWRAYPYYWTWLEFAQVPFSEETVQKILPKLLSEAYVEGLLDKVYTLFSKDKGFDKKLATKQISVMRGQIVNLVRALQMRYTPYELVQMPTFRVDKKGKKRRQIFNKTIPFFSWC
eukprot:Nk52_evm3s378 gene=Nk52_evmTU3s378